MFYARPPFIKHTYKLKIKRLSGAVDTVWLISTYSEYTCFVQVKGKR